MRTTAGKIVFVDFEFAGRGCPTFDVAKLAAMAEFNAGEEDMLLRLWMRSLLPRDRPSPAFLRAQFRCCQLGNAFGNALWAWIQHEIATEPFAAPEWSSAESYRQFGDEMFARVLLGLPEVPRLRRALARVRKCVIPVAGLGSRLFPATKCVPKALFPVPHRLPSGRLELRPLIHLSVAMAVDAGLPDVLVVASPADLPRLRRYFEGAPDPRVVDAGTAAGAARAAAARDVRALARHASHRATNSSPLPFCDR